MDRILPIYKDDRDKIIVIAMVISSIFFIFFPALIVILFLKEQISENSYKIAKSLLNFELMLFLISLTFAIPVIGWLLGFILAPLMMIYNVIICILTFSSLVKGTGVKLPVWYEFI